MWNASSEGGICQGDQPDANEDSFGHQLRAADKKTILRNGQCLAWASFALESALLQKPYIGYICLIMRQLNVTENVCLRVRPTHSITAHWLCDPGQVPNFSVLIFSFSKWDHDHLPCGIIAIVETMYTRQSAAWHIVSRCITSRASYSYLSARLDCVSLQSRV